jgi:hypothetical protein
MSARSSAFVRQLKHRARRFLPGPTRPPSLVTQLPVRPARFPVGLSEPVQWDDLPEAASAPLTPAFYLGRVEETGADGAVVATLWERPSGRELSTTLSVSEHFQGQAPLSGSLLRVWTWVELLEGEDHRATARNRVKVSVETPEASEKELKQTQHLLERLSRGEPGYGKFPLEEKGDDEA